MNKSIKSYKRGSLKYPYLTFSEKLDEYIDTIQKSSKQEVFTFDHFELLGFSKGNDRDFVYLMKHMKIFNEKDIPLDLYDDLFTDDGTKRKEALYNGMLNAYEPLFKINREAYNLTKGDLLEKFKSLYPELNSDEKLYDVTNKTILSKMVNTFIELSNYVKSYIESGIANTVENKYDKYFAIKNSKNEKAVYINIPDTMNENELIDIFNMIKKFLN